MFHRPSVELLKPQQLNGVVPLRALCAMVLLGALIPRCLIAQSKTAHVVVHGKSVQLLPSSAVSVAGVGDVTSYFTTFNGTSGSFLIDTQHGGIVSGEMRPRLSSPEIYEGAYAQATPLVIVDYGSYTASMPTADADGNGIPDAIQYDRPGNFTATGSGYSALAGLTFSISVRFTRAAGSANGSYSATTENSTGQRNTVSGAYSLLSYSGTLTYTRGSTNTMDLSVTGLFTGGVRLTGSTSYTVTNSDALLYGTFTIRGADGSTYQVRAGSMTRSGNTYTGTLSLVDGLPQTYWSDFANYVFSISDTNDSDANGIPDLTDPTAAPPVITSQPKAQNAIVGDNVQLAVAATGAASYQWAKDGIAISGATTGTLSLPNVKTIDSGVYTVKISNGAGSVSSNEAKLTVTPAPIRPSFTIQPLSLVISPGSTLILVVDAIGYPPPAFQWKKNNVTIVGATARSLVITPTTANSAGNYTCIATNSVASTTSATAAITISNSTDAGRIVNLSVRTTAGTGDRTLITGFTVGGTGTKGGKPLFVRGVGPTLSQFTVAGALEDPLLKLYSGSALVAANDDWSGTAQLKAISNAVGAFSLANDTSKDAAIYAPALEPGSYTAQISGAGGSSGVTLAECYDATPGDSFTVGTPRLINGSARAQVGTSAEVLILGFVVRGATAKTLLVRAAGPSLSAFGVTDYLQDPQLSLYAGDSLLNSSDDWNNDPATIAAAASVGAFGFTSPKDSALLLTLPPGSYTAKVNGAGNTTGVAIVELYELPPAPVSNTSDGLIAHYTFDGNGNDITGNGYDAKPMGNFTFLTTGLSRGALRITGDNSLFYSTGGYVQLPSFTADLNSGFTLSIWVRDEIPGIQPQNEENYISFGILDQPRCGISLNSQTKAIDFNIHNGVQGQSKDIFKPIDPSIEYAKWKHLVLTYSPGKMAAYENGEKVGEIAASVNVFPASKAAMGRHWWNGGAASSARMSVTFDNVRIYNRALSDADVQALYALEGSGAP